jgi:surface carbohydrate biosynthesis protein
MNRISLFIPIEIKSRELQAKILLAKYAAERGFDVVMGRKSELHELIMRMPPGVYYGLGTVENFADFYEALAARGHLIVVSDEEGLVTHSDEMYLDLKVSSRTLQTIELLFAWGEENYRVLSTGRPAAAGKLRTTGNPRFDLLKPAFRDVYATELADIRRRYRKYVLICTSFGSCNHYTAGLDYVQSLIEKKVLTSPESIAAYQRFQGVKVAALKAFLEAIPLLARAYPDTDFVVRPHPSENPAPYNEMVAAHGNVHLEDRFSIHPWLLAAQAVVHHYCTSAVEAFAAGIPGFALRPQRDPTLEKEIPYLCSRDCTSPADLVSALRDYLQAPAQSSGRLVGSQRDYSRYVLNMGEAVASELIIAEIYRATESAPKRTMTSWPAISGLGALRQLALRVRGVTAQLLPWRRVNRRYIAHKFDRMSLAEVRRALLVFAPGRAHEFSCAWVGHNVVRIRHGAAK